MERSARRLATLVPALLCVLWSLILTPAASAADPTAAPATHTTPARTVQGPTGPTPGDPKPNRDPGDRAAPAPAPAHRLAPPEPHLAPAAVAGLPAVVEYSVRFPAVPAAPAAVPVDLSLPPRGLLAGDPRRERAPPGGPHVPRDPRGPPSTRHS
ncbi:hypothetical protein [Streptomyces sp. NPDC090135]|uniref:hypothetical protein n=1 Tax=Streptomyces sp. NPDC090135 TaxID=3365957 RepID=UPI003830373B